MPKDKSPGSDGYTVEFLKETWSVLKNDFVASVQSFFKFGFLSKGVNTTILALIPKKKEVKEMKDYRPISCCNVTYRVISKLLANRLKRLLPAFISPNQSAFVKDRLLMENVLLASEVVANYHKDTVSPRTAIKIDISKVNGELSGLFCSERGLRQGCSLSPYLFVICMQVLSALLDKAAKERRIGYHPRCKNICLTHLCFADDLLVFTDGAKTSIEDYTPLLERIRDKFTSWTGRYLSFAGRLQLIGSVIHSLTNFWMSAFRLPKACINEIDSLCSAFLWSGPALNTKKAKVSWADVCLPKEEGGLGLRSLSETNTVSCLKLIWRMLEPNSLWVDLLRTYLLKKGSFWALKDNPSSGSWMWQKLLKYRASAVDFVRYEVKNGEHISFWHDNWSPMGCLFNIAGPRGSIDMGIGLHATVAEALTHRQRHHRVDYLNKMETALTTVRNRGLLDIEDVVLWRGKGDQFKTKFSSKETWDHIRISRQWKTWVAGVWFSQATPKFSFMVWLATLNRLTTGDRMLCWNSRVDASCSFCSMPQEN
ncbi:PREDICTED: uncharacterized protein LOC104710497 [Camelina sativa]|uniref:Uncharacterized protein LOC104710497 n=1 Tax=Camelina sativa TaxID=90675 RepID=A0ABM0TEZ1_CAMSA|nr:PREDICTED: uncharacterized protein LOC104710497 [Camelina sativa]